MNNMNKAYAAVTALIVIAASTTWVYSYEGHLSDRETARILSLIGLLSAFAIIYLGWRQRRPPPSQGTDDE
jgi:hypothetical protein